MNNNNKKGGWLLKHREFIYVGNPIPELKEQEYKAFFLNIQKAVLLSLEKRQLLTHLQKQRCVEEIEKQYNKKNKNHSQV